MTTIHLTMTAAVKKKSLASEESEDDSKNEGTLILDAACTPQNIRFQTDVSLLNKARMNAEEIIVAFHKA